ncbi:hypothetical protein JOL79_07965 [Microbispora sp. RL4-1S]|uniref:Uncharacterized protein n=1 Tax=Microbispora oryzae TaxID=2806554 RepID=A0A941AID8_9ACTN|nr:hypothetical protein [Microbispora oryzae]MBP2703737.1 hypothetical protein [Microbispora oryzae]
MPGARHDATNELVRHHPELVQHLLQTVGGFPLPDNVPLHIHSGELNDRISTNRHADTLILADPPHDPHYGLICEITDPDQAVADPAMATLSVMHHGDRKEVAEAFLIGLSTLDNSARYYEYAHDMAPHPVRQTLEE